MEGRASRIPERTEDLAGLIAEVERQSDEVDALFASLDDAGLRWRPSDDRWSVTGHLAHLCLVNEPYLDLIEERLAGPRGSDVPRGPGPYRHPRMGRWFAGMLEPPPRRRIRTSAKMVPDPGSGPRETLQAFRELQARLASAMADANGVDLGRIRFGSPFLRLLRLSLGTAFAVLLAHNRRHLWLMDELLSSEGAPQGGEDPRPG